MAFWHHKILNKNQHMDIVGSFLWMRNYHLVRNFCGAKFLQILRIGWHLQKKFPWNFMLPKRPTQWHGISQTYFLWNFAFWPIHKKICYVKVSRHMVKKCFWSQTHSNTKHSCTYSCTCKVTKFPHVSSEYTYATHTISSGQATNLW